MSTDDPDCTVDVNLGGSYANWDAFAAAHPTWRVQPGGIPFIIADWPSSGPDVAYVISDIVLR